MVSYAKKVIPEGAQTWWHEYRQAAKDVKRERTGEEGETEVLVHGVEEADQRTKQEGASEYQADYCLGLVHHAHADNATPSTGLATQLALAYAIHKSFIFIRVPLTAAITPKVVKVLRGWGWKIGKKAKR